MTEPRTLTRRKAVSQAGLLLTAALTAPRLSATDSLKPDESRKSPFLYCLNTSTIRGQKLGLAREVEIAAKAGFDAIEPWVSTIEDYAKGGGSLKDLKKQVADLGLTVESAIGFPEWIVDDDTRRAKGLERAKYEMDLIAQLGGKRLAAPPAGATDKPGLDLQKAAERYRALLEAGENIGVVPQLELWGFSKNLNRLSQCTFVAMEAAHPKACVLADVFHLYKGGSDFRALRLLSGHAVQVLHLNDFPADPPREKVDDSYRLYPGDGIAPLGQLLRDLQSTGGRKVLSLELFSKKLWEQDPTEVVRTGFAKMQATVKTALS